MHQRTDGLATDTLRSSCVFVELDAWQSPTLARPAAPLAACDQRISSADETNENRFVMATLLDGSKN